MWHSRNAVGKPPVSHRSRPRHVKFASARQHLRTLAQTGVAEVVLGRSPACGPLPRRSVRGYELPVDNHVSGRGGDRLDAVWPQFKGGRVGLLGSGGSSGSVGSGSGSGPGIGSPGKGIGGSAGGMGICCARMSVSPPRSVPERRPGGFVRLSGSPITSTSAVGAGEVGLMAAPR